MQIQILAAESLGVRSLCCVVDLDGRTIVIDPGLALAPRRQKLPPHPIEVETSDEIRSTIVGSLKRATDIVISHYHGDHHPMIKADPSQLDAMRAAPLLEGRRIWTKGWEGLSRRSAWRRKAFLNLVKGRIIQAEGRREGTLSFSGPVWHGERRSRFGTVMMTRIEDPHGVFVHASDIQLFDDDTVSAVLDWRPSVVVVAGPPIYLSQISGELRERAWQNGLRLARSVETLIVDHHLLRSHQGAEWLEGLAAAGHHVLCAADYMQVPRRMLEAQREQLYESHPVERGWYKAYQRGVTGSRSTAG